MRNALHTRPADDTPYREDMTAHQESEHKLRTFRLFDGMPEDARQIVPRRRRERRPFHVAFVIFCNVLFLCFVIGSGFIYALKLGGWV